MTGRQPAFDTHRREAEHRPSDRCAAKSESEMGRAEDDAGGWRPRPSSAAAAAADPRARRPLDDEALRHAAIKR